MNLTIEKVNYKFIANSIVSFDNIQKTKELIKNDVFEKYEAIAEVKGQLILCNDISKLKTYPKKSLPEIYEKYLSFMAERDSEKDRWIYNIIDGISEQDIIKHRDELCIVIPTYTWNGTDIDKLHILCMPVDKSIRSIRDLTSEHIPLLEHMKSVSLQTIKQLYDLDEYNLKIFVHYDPSTYHFHIHFINNGFTETFSSVEYSHEIHSIIFNLKLNSDYYKLINLLKRY